MTRPVPQCLSCKHYRGIDPPRPGDTYRRMRCDAFPERIPEEIVTMRFDHRHAHPDDHGIRFEEEE